MLICIYICRLEINFTYLLVESGIRHHKPNHPRQLQGWYKVEYTPKTDSQNIYNCQRLLQGGGCYTWSVANLQNLASDQEF